MHRESNFIKLSSDMHHCSTICEYDEGRYLIAFYFGQECTDDQRVAICLCQNGNVISKLLLDYKTGNPVIWNYKNKVSLFYSEFTDKSTDPDELQMAPVKRWMYCTNYLAEIVVDDDKIKIINNKEIPEAFGLLGRCQPIEHEGSLLVPLYRELNPNCQVWEYDNEKFIIKSVFGDVDDNFLNENHLSKDNMNYLGLGVAIQPSIVYFRNCLIAFCRNVIGNKYVGKFDMAWISRSYDNGKTWGKIQQTSIPNNNNSLNLLKYNGRIMMIVNPNKNRSDLLLCDFYSRINLSLSGRFNKGRQSISYPNYLIDSFNNLHVVHTNTGYIAWHIFDKEYMDAVFH